MDGPSFFINAEYKVFDATSRTTYIVREFDEGMVEVIQQELGEPLNQKLPRISFRADGLDAMIRAFQKTKEDLATQDHQPGV